MEPYRFARTPDEVFKAFFGTDNPFAAFIGLAEAFEKEGATRSSGSATAKATLFPLSVTMAELYSGAHKQIRHRRQAFTSSGEKRAVESTLTMDLGGGKRPGHLFSFADEGHAFPGVKPGPAVYRLQVESHDAYSIRGDGKLVYKCRVPLLMAVTGTSVKVPCLDGRNLDIPLKEIVASGTEKVVKGEGLYGPDGNREDLVIEFDVLFPTTISPTQRTLLKAAFYLPDSMGAEQNAAVKGFITAFNDEKNGWARAAAGSRKA